MSVVSWNAKGTTVTWGGKTSDGLPAASGIYFYLAGSVGNATVRGKLILIR